MTELGMVLSNPLHGARLKGCVGQPLPGVRVRVVDEEEQVLVESDEQGRIVERMKGGSSSSSTVDSGTTSGSDSNDGTPGVGELRVKGEGVFSQYLHRPDATAESFDKVTHPYLNTHPYINTPSEHDHSIISYSYNRYSYLTRNDNLILSVTTTLCNQDGWFKTGDIAVWKTTPAPGLADQKQGLAPGQPGSFRLLGRNSIDIIKSSGYKLSALEIEREILAHPQV